MPVRPARQARVSPRRQGPKASLAAQAQEGRSSRCGTVPATQAHSPRGGFRIFVRGAGSNRRAPPLRQSAARLQYEIWSLNDSATGVTTEAILSVEPTHNQSRNAMIQEYRFACWCYCHATAGCATHKFTTSHPRQAARRPASRWDFHVQPQAAYSC